jgi:hypothetical protein
VRLAVDADERHHLFLRACEVIVRDNEYDVAESEVVFFDVHSTLVSEMNGTKVRHTPPQRCCHVELESCGWRSTCVMSRQLTHGTRACMGLRRSHVCDCSARGEGKWEHMCMHRFVPSQCVTTSDVELSPRILAL